MDWRTVPYGLTTTEKEWADGGLIAYRPEYPQGPLSEHFKRTEIGRIINQEPVNNTSEKQKLRQREPFFLRWVILTGENLPELPVGAAASHQSR